MWTYNQRTGTIQDPDALIVGPPGYSGYGENRNKPELQDQPHVGPLPRGLYIFLFAIHHDHLGPLAMKLIPHPDNRMFGRSEFWIHGKSIDNPATPEDESVLSSHGCICKDRETRDEMNVSDDRVIQVI